MGNDLDAARAIDRTFVRASRAHALASELKALVAASLALVAEVDSSEPARLVCAWKLAKVANRANETLRVSGY